MRGVVREQGEQLLQAEGPVERALTSLGVLEAPGVQGELVARETVQAAPEMERAVREALGSPGMARWTLRLLSAITWTHSRAPVFFKDGMPPANRPASCAAGLLVSTGPSEGGGRGAAGGFASPATAPAP